MLKHGHTEGSEVNTFAPTCTVMKMTTVSTCCICLTLGVRLFTKFPVKQSTSFLSLPDICTHRKFGICLNIYFLKKILGSDN